MCGLGSGWASEVDAGRRISEGNEAGCMMRVVLLIVGVWGLWVMPVLCDGGLVAECCEEAGSETHDAGCECPGCVQLCDAQVTKPAEADKVTGGSAKSVVAVLISTSDESVCGGRLVVPDLLRVSLNRVRLPFPPSDRPLLL